MGWWRSDRWGGSEATHVGVGNDLAWDSPGRPPGRPTRGFARERRRRSKARPPERWAVQVDHRSTLLSGCRQLRATIHHPFAPARPSRLKIGAPFGRLPPSAFQHPKSTIHHPKSKIHHPPSLRARPSKSTPDRHSSAAAAAVRSPTLLSPPDRPSRLKIGAPFGRLPPSAFQHPKSTIHHPKSTIHHPFTPARPSRLKAGAPCGCRHRRSSIHHPPFIIQNPKSTIRHPFTPARPSRLKIGAPCGCRHWRSTIHHPKFNIQHSKSTIPSRPPVQAG